MKTLYLFSTTVPIQVSQSDAQSPIVAVRIEGGTAYFNPALLVRALREAADYVEKYGSPPKKP